MSIPILTTKLFIPPSRLTLVPRCRLIEQVEAGVHAKLSLVLAPAGFGKTTLITSWIRQKRDGNERLVAWLSLDENDNDLVRFLSYMIAALQTIDQKVGQTAISLLNATQLPPIENLLTLLINDIANLPSQAVLVLDDYHFISNPDIHRGMAFLVEHLPPHFHLIIITREAPPLPLHRLRVRGQVTEIGIQGLRFSLSEVADFLRQVIGLQLTPDLIQALEERTEGWVAGLQMAALSLRSKSEPGIGDMAQAIRAFGGKHRYVIDYLAQEVMRQQSDTIRRFLYQTAILDRFTAPLCEAVTGQNNGQVILAQLEQANLFLINLDDQRQWYRYHHLFADFLRAHLSESDRYALHQKASAWYEAHDLIPEAIQHAIAADNTETAERLIEQISEEMLSHGQLALILSWLNALPVDIVHQNSYFATMKGWILYLRGERREAERYAALAQAHLSNDASLIHKGTLLAFQARLANNRGETAQGVKLASSAINCLSNSHSFFHTTAYLLLGEAQRLTGDKNNAIQTFAQTIQLGQQYGQHLITAVALWHLALLLYFQGQRREAQRLCEQAASEHLDAHGQPAPLAGFVHVPLGLLYYEGNMIKEAEHHLEIGLALCQQLGIPKYTLIGQCTLAKIHYTRRDVETAFQLLLSARQMATQLAHPEESRFMAAMIADMHLRAGHLPAALQWAKSAGFPTEPPSEPEEWLASQPERVCLTYVRLLLAQRQAQAAQSWLQKLEEKVLTEGRNGRLLTIYILQALALDAENKKAVAYSRLEQALRLAAPENYQRSFLDEGIAVASLLPKLAHVAPTFVAKLLAAFGIVESRDEDKTAQPSSPLLNPLKERELEIMQLVAHGDSNRQIAKTLGLTVGTIKWYLNQIYRKLDVRNRTQAVARLRELNLL